MNRRSRRASAGYATRKIIFFLVFSSTLPAAGCTSPADKADQYYHDGISLLEQGNGPKAALQFQNALQIKADMVSATYGLALVAEQGGEWAKMHALLDRVITQSPSHWQALLKRGQLMLGGGRIADASEASNKLLVVAPDESAVLVFHAAVLFEQGAMDESAAIAREVLARQPTNVEAVAILVNERRVSNEKEEALTLLDTAIAAIPENIGLQLLRVEVLEAVGDLDRALDSFRQLADGHVDNEAIQNAYSRFLLRHGRTDDAEAVLKAIVMRAPSNVNAKLELVRFTVGAKGATAAIKELEAYVLEMPKEPALTFSLADLHRSNGDASKGKKVLAAFSKANPGTHIGMEAKERLATALFVEGERQASTRLIDEILAQDPTNGQALFLHASVAIENRQLDTAISDLRRLLSDAPDSPRTLFAIAEAYKLSGSRELANSHYLRAFRSSGAAPFYGIAYSEFLLQDGRLDQADQVLALALESDTDNLTMLTALAQVRLQRGDWDGAETVAGQLSAAQGGLAEAGRVRGAIFAARHEYDASIAAYTEAYRVSPAERIGLVTLVNAYIGAGKSEAAADFLDGVLQSNPRAVTALLLRGQLHQLAGRRDDALAYFNETIRLAPKEPDGYLSAGGLYLREGNFSEALRLITQGLEAAPETTRLSIAKAEIHEEAGQPEVAIEIYESLLEGAPNSDIVANNLAALLVEYRRDIESIQRAHDLARRFQRSDVPQFRDTLAWTHYHLGQYAEAASLLKGAIAQRRDDPLLHFHLGMSYIGLDNLSGARTELQRALDMAGTQHFAEADNAEAALLQVTAAASGE